LSLLDDALGPVGTELRAVERDIRGLADSFAYPSSREIAGRFFGAPGKFLRPALVMLAAKAVRNDLAAVQEKLVQTGVGVELIHGASLVHDDIIDGDVERRGQPTVHRLWGTKIALLMGDALYSRAFALLTEALPQELLLKVVRMNEGMCSAEIESANRGEGLSRSDYMSIIKGKTAAFMSVCCLVGARVAGADARQAEALERFGMGFGMAYQLFDDTADRDAPVPEVDAPREAEQVLSDADKALAELPPTLGRSGLEALSRHLREANRYSAEQRKVP
jgi:octaprenyl-diphosphate synthase